MGHCWGWTHTYERIMRRVARFVWGLFGQCAQLRCCSKAGPQLKGKCDHGGGLSLTQAGPSLVFGAIGGQQPHEPYVRLWYTKSRRGAAATCNAFQAACWPRECPPIIPTCISCLCL